ncbi:MAG: hypothetical protein HOY69_21985 [Streptomyces sp.]|nr:hypothetical protein [Streptomyces sp.]
MTTGAGDHSGAFGTLRGCAGTLADTWKATGLPFRLGGNMPGRGVRGVYRSDDAGRHWTRINDDRHQYGWTGAAITGDPRIHGRVYLGTDGRGVLYGDLRSGDRRSRCAASGDVRRIPCGRRGRPCTSYVTAREASPAPTERKH